MTKENPMQATQILLIGNKKQTTAQTTAQPQPTKRTSTDQVLQFSKSKEMKQINQPTHKYHAHFDKKKIMCFLTQWHRISPPAFFRFTSCHPRWGPAQGINMGACTKKYNCLLPLLRTSQKKQRHHRRQANIGVTCMRMIWFIISAKIISSHALHIGLQDASPNAYVEDALLLRSTIFQGRNTYLTIEKEDCSLKKLAAPEAKLSTLSYQDTRVKVQPFVMPTIHNLSRGRTVHASTASCSRWPGPPHSILNTSPNMEMEQQVLGTWTEGEKPTGNILCISRTW